MCLFSFFSPVCPPPDLELNEPTSSTLLQGQYPLCLLFSSPLLSPKALTLSLAFTLALVLVFISWYS